MSEPRTGEEEGDDFVDSLVGDAGEQAALSETEGAADSKEAGEVVDNTQHDGHETPDHHDARNPDRRTEALHGNVGGDFRSHVEREEDGDSNLESDWRMSALRSNNQSTVVVSWLSTHIVIKASHAQILLEPSKPSITNICAIQEGQQIQQGEEGQEVPVHLAKHLLGRGHVVAGVLNPDLRRLLQLANVPVGRGRLIVRVFGGRVDPEIFIQGSHGGDGVTEQVMLCVSP